MSSGTPTWTVELDQQLQQAIAFCLELHELPSFEELGIAVETRKLLLPWKQIAHHVGMIRGRECYERFLCLANTQVPFTSLLLVKHDEELGKEIPLMTSTTPAEVILQTQEYLQTASNNIDVVLILKDGGCSHFRQNTLHQPMRLGDEPEQITASCVVIHDDEEPLASEGVTNLFLQYEGHTRSFPVNRSTRVTDVLREGRVLANRSTINARVKHAPAIHIHHHASIRDDDVARNDETVYIYDNWPDNFQWRLVKWKSEEQHKMPQATPVLNRDNESTTTFSSTDSPQPAAHLNEVRVLAEDCVLPTNNFPLPTTDFSRLRQQERNTKRRRLARPLPLLTPVRRVSQSDAFQWRRGRSTLPERHQDAGRESAVHVSPTLGAEMEVDSDTSSDAEEEPAVRITMDHGAGQSRRRSPRVRARLQSNNDNIPNSPVQNDTISLDPDESLLGDRCCNCRRTLPAAQPRHDDPLHSCYTFHIAPVNLNDGIFHNLVSERRKFCFVDSAAHPTIPDGTRPANLCGNCYCYLTTPPSRNRHKTDESAVWPSFVWKILSSDSHGQKAWKLLPLQWKQWWARSYGHLHRKNPHHAANEDSVFSEVTQDQQADLLALQNLSWANDIKPRELSLCLATVKCPAGCCEWKHKTNRLPLDIVFEFCIDEELILYSPPSKRHMTNWFRRDYVLEDNLLLNPNWKVRPSISFDVDKLVPTVLCCRDHKASMNRSMLHPSRHPATLVATEKAGQFSPVIPVPRTLRKAQAKAYSASFQVAQMEGSFYGLDTMFLSADGGNYHHNQSLAYEQEVLSVNGRPDLRAHISKLSAKNKVIPSLAASLLEDRKEFFPLWDETASLAKRGATVMVMEDAVRLQQNLMYDREEVVVIKENGKPPKQQWCRGSWPRQLAFVHPAEGHHGATVCKMLTFTHGFNTDARNAWLLCSVTSMVPALWHATVQVPKYNWRHEGHLLTLLTSKCYPEYKLKGSNRKSNPFRNWTLKRFYDDYVKPTAQHGYSPSSLRAMFEAFDEAPDAYKSVSTLWDDFSIPEDDSKTVCLVFKRSKEPRPWTESSRKWLPKEEEYGDWQLCFVGISEVTQRNPFRHIGIVYSRHGGCNFQHWWKSSTENTLPVRKPPDWHLSSVSNEKLNNWRLCVYIRKNRLITTELRNQVLGACGGQSRVTCEACHVPLIVTPPLKTRKCCALNCGRQVRYKCPSDDCTAAICKKHCEELMDSETSPCKVPPLPLSDCFVSSDDESTTSSEASQVDLHVAGICSDESDDEGPTLADIDLARRSSKYPNEIWAAEAMNNLRETAFVCADNYGMDSADVDVTECVAEERQCLMTDDMSVNVPTTNSGQEPITGTVNQGEYAEHRMSNHALLNTYGSCLLRKNSRLSGSLAQQAFLQKQVATTQGESIPLIHPEAMLFSSLFPFAAPDGSPIGALPAAMLQSDAMLRKYGLADLHDHYRTRLKSPALLASADPKYHFYAFDALANFSLRGADSRLILQRGFAESQGRGGVRLTGNREPIFDSDHVESRAVVNKLAATIGERMPTYFYTHTCSMRTHFGMRYLYEHITGDEVMRLHCKECTEHDRAHWQKSLLDSSGTYLLRAWVEILQIWIMYITKSPDMPMGKVVAFWGRLELQDPNLKGNLPHLHAAITTDDDLTIEAGIMAAADRIRGFVDDMVRPEEQERMLEEGIFESPESVNELKDFLRKVLPHKHRRRCYVITKRTDENGSEVKKACKVTDNWNSSDNNSEHSFLRIPVKHSQEAIEIMQALGVAAATPSDHPEGKDVDFVPLLDWLDPIKHIPPAHGDEGIISPVIGVLVAINPNTDNCQLTSGYFISRYLAKYISKIDEYGRIYVTPPKSLSDPGRFDIDGKTVLNTKITSNKLHLAEQATKTSSKKRSSGLAINVADVYLKIFGYPTIVTNCRTVKISTDTFENRPGRERKRKPIHAVQKAQEKAHRGPQTVALTPMNSVPPHHARKSRSTLPLWRQFKSTQVQKMFDDLHSPLVPDSVTKFGFRPPELQFIMHQIKYHRWFKAVQLQQLVLDANGNFVFKPVRGLPAVLIHCTKSLSISADLTETDWITGDCKGLRVRAAALDEILPYLEEAPLSIYHHTSNIAASSIKGSVVRMFVDISHAHMWINKGIIPHGPDTHQPLPLDRRRYELICRRFVCEPQHKFLPTPWMNQARPTQPQRFLIHLLLSFGAFIDEYDLFSCGSLRSSFIRARLLDPNNPESSSTRLMKKYFMLQLKYLPCGTPTFDRYCCAAYNCISTFFQSNVLHTDEMPSVLYRRLRTETGQRMKEFAISKQTTFIHHIWCELSSAGIAPLPTQKECMDATFEAPLAWDITKLNQPSSQPSASYLEQNELLAFGKSCIDQYAQSTTKTPPSSTCVVGAGGVGKTTCAQILVLYARTRGCSVAGTTLMSERAQELGVEHWNKDLCVPVCNIYETTPGKLAEKMLASLYRQPERMEYLRTCDVYFIDEMGPIPAEYWSARDITLRHITGSSLPNGGCLDIVTFDHLQVHPVNGTHPLLSPFIVSTYSFRRLLQSVRAAAHKGWMRLQEITRLSPHLLSNSMIENEWVSLFVEHVGSAESDEEVPRDALFVYGKNSPIRLHQRRVIERLRGHAGVLFSISVDLERNYQGRFTDATPRASGLLDTKVREQHTLPLFYKGRYRITDNRHPHYSNGQIAFLHKLPLQSVIDRKQPILLLVAPPGSTYLPGDDDTEESLVQNHGWKEVKVTTARERTLRASSGRLKRTEQYALQLFVASTFHSVLGKTLAKLASKVDAGGGKDALFSIWDQTQVVILMSRTKLPGDTIFVTKDKVATAKAIYSVLSRSTPFRLYLSQLLDNLCRGGGNPNQPVNIDCGRSIYRPRDVSLPPQPTGYVYLLVSTQDTSFLYIGSTNCLITRFRQHNSGYGSKQTAPPSLRPWGILGYVCGFQGDEKIRTSVENDWIVAKEELFRGRSSNITLQSVIDLILPILRRYNRENQDSNLNLKFFNSGTVSVLQQQPEDTDDQTLRGEHDSGSRNSNGIDCPDTATEAHIDITCEEDDNDDLMLSDEPLSVDNSDVSTCSDNDSYYSDN